MDLTKEVAVGSARRLKVLALPQTALLEIAEIAHRLDQVFDRGILQMGPRRKVLRFANRFENSLLSILASLIDQPAMPQDSPITPAGDRLILDDGSNMHGVAKHERFQKGPLVNREKRNGVHVGALAS